MTDEDDEFARIERENAMKGQPYHFTKRKDEDDDIQEYVRPWKGLTKEERHEISMANKPYVADIMAAHEEELKRRNT
jgi:hypothetical protein